MKVATAVRFAVVSLPAWGAALACERPEWTVVEGAVAGNTSAGTPAVLAGSSGSGPLAEQCAFDRSLGTKPIFGAQAVNSSLPARAELYALVSDSEATALRGGGPLVPPPEDPPRSPDVVQLLEKIMLTSTALRRPLIQELQRRFASVRVVWPNPWALRLVGHAGTEHMNPVRLVLRDDAWIARITQGSIVVLDTQNGSVGIDQALAEPERIAGIFYEINQLTYLDSQATACDEGKRELVIASDEMVQEWSLGTEEIVARQNEDVELLNEFFKVARQCTMFDRGATFHSYTVCTTWPSFNVFSEYTAYQWALSTPNELYKPTPQNLASLIEALQADSSEPDPYRVEPAPPVSSAAGGEGGATGAGGAPAAGGAPSQ